MTKTVRITEGVLLDWLSDYGSRFLKDEIDYEIKKLAAKALEEPPEKPQITSVIPLTIRNWLNDIGAVYVEHPPCSSMVVLEFEDENVATQFVLTWLT